MVTWRTFLHFIQQKHASGGAAVLIAIALIGSSYLLFAGLGVQPFQDYDEATYAEISLESGLNHSYIAPMFLGNEFFRKPPFLFWLIDVSNEFVSNPEVAARLPSALSAFALIILVMVVVFEVTRNGCAAGFTGIVLMTTSAFIEPARQVRFDLLVSFFTVATVYAFLKGFDNRRWFIPAGVLFALTILSKGPLAVFAVVGALSIAVYYKRFNWLRDKYFWIGAALSLLVAAPWHIYESVRFGYIFWEDYLGDQVLDRVGQTLFNGPTNADYINYLLGFATPWILVFGVAILVSALLWKRMSKKAQAMFGASVVTVLAVLAVCFISKTKAGSYLISLYPFVAIAVGIMAFELYNHFHSRARILLTTALIILSMAGFELSIYNGFHLNGYYATADTLAVQEKVIGEVLLTQNASQFYVYDTTTLGSIMFYSRLLHPIGLGPGGVPPVGSYVLYQTLEVTQLHATYPTITFTTDYSGSALTLATVGAED